MKERERAHACVRVCVCIAGALLPGALPRLCRRACARGMLQGPSTTVPAGVPLPVMLCYFHVVRDEAAAEAATKVEQDDDQGEDDQGNEQDSGDQQQSYFSSDHVLCLLRQFASQDVELDLFRPELDAYCKCFARWP